MRAIPCFTLFTAIVAALTLSAAGQDALDPAASFQLAAQLYDAGRYREALEAYDLATRGGDAALAGRARRGKVRAALRVAEFELARREAETLVAAPAADAEARTLHADALWATGLFDEADAAYRTALEAAPGSARARFGLARSLATRSRLEDALAEASSALAASPDDAEVHALLGHVSERLGRFDEAADAYERYTALLPIREDTMAAVFLAKVQLLRSFAGRTPLSIDPQTAGRVHRARFKLVNKKIVLQGRLNGTAVELVLDTGAERTGISRATARRAGVRPVTTTLTAGVGASVRRLDLARADSLEIGSFKIRNVPVSIRNPAPNAMPRWQSESFSPISLGLSVLIDYQRQEVALAKTLPASSADVRLPMRVNRLPMVRGLLNSTRPAYFVVDTGGEVISISAETARALAMMPVRRIPLRVYGMSGWDSEAFLLPGVDLDFDAIEYRKVGLAVLNLRAPSVFLGFQLGGIVGHEFLSDYRVSMDVGRSELRLEKP
ncbi:MAG: retroviral-like aspartic protease family protein [Acidobacteria bacterium]|nr:retroviral-like aspartic protease family protein [Acidobacteriota bacterium]